MTNALIAMSGRSFNPLKIDAEVAAVQQAEQQNALGQFDLQQKQDAAAQGARLQGLLASGADGNALIRAGFFDQGMKYQKHQADAAKAEVDLEKEKLAVAIQKAGRLRQLISSARDPQSYAQAVQSAQREGFDVSDVPPQYDPAFVQNMAQEALTVSQRLEQVWKEKDYSLDVRKQGEAERHNRSSEETARGQLGVAQGNFGLRRQEAQDARAGAAKAPAGYRWKSDGTLEAIPGGPAVQKLGTESAKVTDARDVLSLLDEAEPLLDKATASYVGQGVDFAARAVGKSTPGAEAAAQLKTIEGLLISKMPKMTGPQSDKDVMLYRQMAGQIGDASLPAATRRAAAEQIRRINERYVGGQGAKPGAAAFDDLPPASQYAGKTVRDQDTGKRLRSNGSQWVEVK